MENVSMKLYNGNTIEYVRIPSGTCFHAETPAAVRLILENARLRGERLRLFYGDVETGRDWLEELDTMGTIGRSTGRIQVPLLIRNRRSSGGPAILDHCIVKIMRGRDVLYQAANYHQGELRFQERPLFGLPADRREYRWAVMRDDGPAGPGPRGGGVFARFKSEKQAIMFIEFLQGRRHNHGGGR